MRPAIRCSRSRQTVRRAHRQARLVAAFEAGDPHHEEFVEIDAKIARNGPLQQWLRGVLSERGGLWVEPSQLTTVEVAIVGEIGEFVD